MKMISSKEMDLGKIITFIFNISFNGFNFNTNLIQQKKYNISRSSKKTILSSN